MHGAVPVEVIAMTASAEFEVALPNGLELPQNLGTTLAFLASFLVIIQSVGRVGVSVLPYFGSACQ